ncbi:MAG: hypothetical protein LBP33_11925 [Candidatus Adiutrix sp.]|nr:hypothetical protein [Candidatus Adiutrix sp.]
MRNYIYCDRKKNRPPRPGRRLTGILVLALAGVILLELGLMARELKSRYGAAPGAPVVEVRSASASGPAPPAAGPELGKKDLAELIGARDLPADEQRLFSVTDRRGNHLYVRTTILPELQALGDSWVKGSRAHQAALVLLDPDSGEVLTLAGYSENEGDPHPALAGSFPAASLFKIVTAAAAVEKAELSADSRLAYDGGKHTLFKNNVAKEADEGRRATTLRESFADSINSVFGKLGASTLGSGELADFAARFGFNHEIDFEMPVEASSFSVDDDDAFHLAELASGYNRATKVSPLHGALMAAAVAAGGNVYDPSLVREVFDRENRIYYQAGRSGGRQVISPATAGELSRLMLSAVEEGTGRRTFGNASAHPVLSRLLIGGKSGTINNDLGQKVDWFVAWAQPRPGEACPDRLALSAVVVHSGATRTTSQRLVRDALDAYYRERLDAGNSPTSKPGGAAFSGRMGYNGDD